MGQGGQADGSAQTSQSAQPTAGQQYATMGSYALSGLISGYGAIRAGRMQDRMERWNARIDEIRATNAENRGVFDSNQIRMHGRRLIGAQRAGFAGQNVVVDSGTAASVVEDTQIVTNEDANTARANAMLEAWGFRVEATGARMRGIMARNRGTQEAVGGFLSAGARIGEYHDRMSR